MATRERMMAKIQCGFRGLFPSEDFGFHKNDSLYREIAGKLAI
ncbi:MAG: hypothetical protein AAF664_07555 [Planctomycetota bacterium]